MSGHPSVELLARYAGGDLGGWRAGRVRAHLGGCPDCTAALANLSRVSEVLAAARPPAIPAAVASRLDAALAAAVAERAAGAAGASPSAAREHAPAASAEIPGRPDLPERAGRRGRPSRPAGRGNWRASPLVLRGLAAAGAVVVIAGGGLVLSRLSLPSSSSSSSTATSGSAMSSPSGPSDHAKVGAASAPRAAAPPQPSPALEPAVLQLPYSRSGVPSTTTVVVTAQNLDAATLAAGVRHTLAALPRGGTGNKAGGTLAQNFDAGTVGGFTATALQGCVSWVSAGAEVRLVELARYRGVPVAIIVSASSPSASTLQVIVVGTGCSAGNSDVIARSVIPAQN